MNVTSLREKYFGTKRFYLSVLSIALPIMVQNGMTNVVSLLDNIMVGRLGTDPMSGVSIIGNLMFVYIMVCFGAVSGPGIFCAQFFGKGDHKGVAECFRAKLYIVGIMLLLFVVLMLTCGDKLINLYLHDSGDGIGSIPDTFAAAKTYLMIMLIGLPALAISTVYASTLRECGETMLPMKAGIAAVAVDLVFNWLLIFGELGFPKLGVAGAAIATVMSRYVECLINVIWTHTHTDRVPFARHIFEKLTIRVTLLKNVVIKGLPLMMNEILWVLAMVTVTQCYSCRGLSVIAALNINSTVAKVFNIVFVALGSSVAIFVGQKLGAGKIDEAKAVARKLIVFSCLACVLTSVVMASVSGVFPLMFKTEPAVRETATSLIIINAAVMPLQAISHASYFAIRSGGKTFITFLFDSVFSWVIVVPTAYVLAHYTSLSIVSVFAVVLYTEIIKVTLAIVFLRKLNWAVKIVPGADDTVPAD